MRIYINPKTKIEEEKFQMKIEQSQSQSQFQKQLLSEKVEEEYCSKKFGVFIVPKNEHESVFQIEMESTNILEKHVKGISIILDRSKYKKREILSCLPIDNDSFATLVKTQEYCIQHHLLFSIKREENTGNLLDYFFSVSKQHMFYEDEERILTEVLSFWES